MANALERRREHAQELLKTPADPMDEEDSESEVSEVEQEELGMQILGANPVTIHQLMNKFTFNMFYCMFSQIRA